MMKENDNLEITGLSWQPQAASKPVLEGISLTLEAGHSYGIIGPNGAGKSSLLRHILRFLPVRVGEITLSGRGLGAYTRRELAKCLSFVPQETFLDTDFTAREVVLTGRSPYVPRFGRETGRDVRIAEEAMDMTGSTAYGDRAFFSLSGGEAQRVVVARALAQQTPWMLLDEPVSNLDIRNQVELMRNLFRLRNEQGISLLMVLHDINLAAAFCDRLIMMKNGRILCAGDTAEVLSAKRLEELYGIGFFCVRGEDGTGRWYPKMHGEAVKSENAPFSE